MSSTSTTDVELGRAIRVLQRSVTKPTWYAMRYRAKKAKRHFTDNQICELLHINKKQMEKAVTAYQVKYRQHPSATQGQWADYVTAFVRKYDRWPTTGDIKREPEMFGGHSRHAFYRVWRSNTWRSTNSNSMSTCIAWMVRNRWKVFTPKRILAIPNVTTRQQAMQKYGIERLLQKMGGEPFQQDDFGKLWRLPSDNPVDPHAQWVEVVNSTPEPDTGKYLHFFLRVPPSINTAREAVFWTFPDLDVEGAKAAKYRFAKQS